MTRLGDDKLSDYPHSILPAALPRSTVDGTHAHVLDLFITDRRLARCVCLDCWQSWDEGAASLPACSLPSSVVLAVDPSRSNPKQNLTDLNAEVAR